MTAKRSTTNPLRAAEENLTDLRAEFRRFGVTGEDVRTSLSEDSQFVGRNLFLRPHAFRPTGVALGYPLPEPGLQRLFSELTNRADEYLRRLCSVDGPTISRVPPVAYHITLVNRTHFDEGGKRTVRKLSLAEYKQVEFIIRSRAFGPVAVRYLGLVATRRGRLTVPACSVEANAIELKEALRNGVLAGPKREPVLAGHYPVQMMTKLGHLVVELDGLRLQKFCRWMCDQYIRIDLDTTFVDVYTQHGRVPL